MLFLSSCSYNDVSDIKTDIEILDFCNATQEDFKKYNSAFSGQDIEFNVDDYRLLKVRISVLNKNNFSIGIQGAECIKNNYFYLPGNSVDIEPTYPIASNQQIDLDIYIYVHNSLTDENEISEKLNELSITMRSYKVN